MERQLSFSVGRFTIDLSGKSTVVLTADSNVQKRYFLICFSFNRKLDRWLDIVQMMLQGLHKAGINGRTHIIHIIFLNEVLCFVTQQRRVNARAGLNQSDSVLSGAHQAYVTTFLQNGLFPGFFRREIAQFGSTKFGFCKWSLGFLRGFDFSR